MLHTDAFFDNYQMQPYNMHMHVHAYIQTAKHKHHEHASIGAILRLPVRITAWFVPNWLADSSSLVLEDTACPAMHAAAYRVYL